jgi:hypothetical protein
MKTLSTLIASAAVVFASSAAYAQNGANHVAPAPHVNAPAPHGAQQQAHPAAAPAAPKAAAPKAAAPPQVHIPTQQIAQRWAIQHDVPVRTVEVGPPERRVTRMFVPVAKKDWASFHDTFAGSEAKQSMVLVLQSGDSHMTVNMGGEEFLWARPNKYTTDYGRGAFYGNEWNEHPPMDGKAIVINMTKEEYAHAQTWFQHRKDPKDFHFSTECGTACMDYIGNIEVAPSKDGVDQLRTVTKEEAGGHRQVEVAPGKFKSLTGSAGLPGGRKLFDMLGVARSKDGRNMGFNLTHAATDRVQVIGVPIADIPPMEPKVIRENGRVFVRYVPVGGGVNPLEHFKTMSDAELLGPLPPQGIAGVVRPVK